MPPVQAPVSDPFRPPDGPYGAGNRGIEYDTRPGQVVRAAAGGTVSFAGTVAGELHVTVDHGGGVLSTYSYLERISVRTGAEVTRGETVGLSGELLHFSVRVDGQYVDPAGFVGVRRVRVRLVPLRVQRHRAAGAAGSVHLPVGLTGPDGAMAASPNHFATRAFTRSP